MPAVTAAAMVAVSLLARATAMAAKATATQSVLAVALRSLRLGARIAPVLQPDGSPLRHLDMRIRPVG
jgi:hypothetical protein